MLSTMPKRPHIAEDVDEEVATPSSKRARNAESNSDSEDQQSPSQKTQTRKRAQAKGKGRTQESDSEDEERDKSKDEEMDDEQFENVYGEKLRVRLEEKRRTQGVSCLVNWM